MAHSESPLPHPNPLGLAPSDANVGGWKRRRFVRRSLAVLIGISVALIPWLFHLTRQSRWDRHLGNLSYTVYLAHVLVWNVMVQGLHLRNGALGALLTITFSAMLYRWVEIPVDRYRQARARPHPQS